MKRYTYKVQITDTETETHLLDLAVQANGYMDMDRQVTAWLCCSQEAPTGASMGGYTCKENVFENVELS